MRPNVAQVHFRITKHLSSVCVSVCVCGCVCVCVSVCVCVCVCALLCFMFVLVISMLPRASPVWAEAINLCSRDSNRVLRVTGGNTSHYTTTGCDALHIKHIFTFAPQAKWSHAELNRGPYGY